jgi:DNA transposition AAA+ family ATPase
MDKNPSPIDTLIGQSRVMGESRVIRHADADRVTHEDAIAVIERVTQFLRRNNGTLSHVARSIGRSVATVSQVMRLDYSGRWQEVILLLDRWLEDEHKSRQFARPEAFVETRIAEEIYAVAEAAMHLRSIGVVYGPSGIGKTLALRAMAAEKPGSIFLSIETIGCTSAGVVEGIARQLRVMVGSKKSYSSRFLVPGIIERLAGTGRLVIIDEIHKLCGKTTDAALHVLRDLHDHTGCPMLWCGTIDLLAYLEREAVGLREPLEQIRSRIAPCRDLADAGTTGGGRPLYTIDEIRRVFSHWKLRLTPDAEAELLDLANADRGGHLRTCERLLGVVGKLYANETKITAAMLRKAIGLLLNRRGRDVLEDRRASGGRVMVG